MRLGLVRGAARPPRTVAEDEFVTAKRAYLERYSDSVKREQTWRTVSLVMIAGCAGLAWSNAVLANRPAYVPYLVEVDQLGAVVPVRPADQAARVPDRVVMNQIGRFIRDTRSVFIDENAARSATREALASVADGSQALKVLEDYYGAATSPLKRAATQTVAVEIRSILLVGGDTWRVEWRETVADRDGNSPRTEAWTALVTVEHRTPNDKVAIEANPLGVFVKDLRWSRQL